jgi:hypothetical protein
MTVGLPARPQSAGAIIAKLFVEVAAAVILLALFFRAFTTFDQSWDTVAYHAPWAARLMGLCDPSCFELAWFLEKRFQSFPILVEWLQGAAWWLTGRPEAINLPSFASLIALIVYLQIYWRVPWAWATLAFCAVPFVQIFATIAYIDLPTNVAAAIAVLALLSLLLNRDLTPAHLAIAALAVVFLGNSKTQMMPVAGLIAVAVVLGSTILSPAGLLSLRSYRGWLLGLLLGLALSATALRNLVVFGNPVYPVQFLGLPGVEYAFIDDQAPEYLRGLPHGLVWLFSIIEFSALDGRRIPYTVGNGEVPITAPSYRMGGYFGFYVLISLGLLAIAALRTERRIRMIVFSFVGVVTVVVAFLPASSELRYYMFWFLLILCLNLWLFLSPRVADWAGRAELGLAFKAITLCCFVAVVAWTGGDYLKPGPSLREALVERGIQQTIDTEIADGSVTCSHELQTAFLYADVFQPGRNYQIVQKRPPECN